MVQLRHLWFIQNCNVRSADLQGCWRPEWKWHKKKKAFYSSFENKYYRRCLLVSLLRTKEFIQWFGMRRTAGLLLVLNIFLLDQNDTWNHSVGMLSLWLLGLKWLTTRNGNIRRSRFYKILLNLYIRYTELNNRFLYNNRSALSSFSAISWLNNLPCCAVALSMSVYRS